MCVLCTHVYVSGGLLFYPQSEDPETALYAIRFKCRGHYNQSDHAQRMNTHTHSHRWILYDNQLWVLSLNYSVVYTELSYTDLLPPAAKSSLSLTMFGWKY